MAVKNLIILGSLVPMMIGWAMPMSYHSTKLSIREGTDAASSAALTSPSGLGTREDDSTAPMPRVFRDNAPKESVDKTAPEPPTAAPWDSAKPTSREADNSSENAVTSTSSQQTAPTVPSSSSNVSSPSHPIISKPMSAASYLHSTKLQLITYWSAVSLLAFIA